MNSIYCHTLGVLKLFRANDWCRWGVGGGGASGHPSTQHEPVMAGESGEEGARFVSPFNSLSATIMALSNVPLMFDSAWIMSRVFVAGMVGRQQLVLNKVWKGLWKPPQTLDVITSTVHFVSRHLHFFQYLKNQRLRMKHLLRSLVEQLWSWMNCLEKVCRRV